MKEVRETVYSDKVMVNEHVFVGIQLQKREDIKTFLVIKRYDEVEMIKIKFDTLRNIIDKATNVYCNMLKNIEE